MAAKLHPRIKAPLLSHSLAPLIQFLGRHPKLRVRACKSQCAIRRNSSALEDAQRRRSLVQGMRISLWNPCVLKRGPDRLVIVPLSYHSFNHPLRRSYSSVSKKSNMSSTSTPTAATPTVADYSSWSNESLIARITELERQLNSYTGAVVTPSSSSSSSSSAAASAAAAQPRPGALETSQPRSRSSSRSRKPGRAIDPSKYNTRYIALKFAYLGQGYNGFEHTNGNLTPLPTVEEEMYKALRKARLIFPNSGVAGMENLEQVEEEERLRLRPLTIDWEGSQYSKCGRTDRGVSAFGQVIGIRVRSARPKKEVKNQSEKVATEMEAPRTASEEVTEAQSDDPFGGMNVSDTESSAEEDDWDDIADELPYIHMLNNVLPKDIRVLAWAPNPPPDFDARFSCRERHYRYFFTQPAFTPTPGPRGLLDRSKCREGWLDIEAMREGARYFVGSHDFRNFCKLDTSKQITNFVRKISHADIELAPDPLSYLRRPEFAQFQGYGLDQVLEIKSHDPAVQVYTFTLHGSAFLWHQVRHMVAILFLIGQGLESPSIVRELLDVEKNPRKPTYEMASDAPLVLWDCVFPGKDEGGLEWVYAGDQRAITSGSSKGDGKFGIGGIVDDLWANWRKCKIDEIVVGSLLDTAVKQGDGSPLLRGGAKNAASDKSRSQRMFYGGNESRFSGKYVPLMKRQKLEPVEFQNERYMAVKGNKKLEKRGRAKESKGDDGK